MAAKSLSNRFMHLTNYSVNKKNSAFTPNSDETVCQGHKWFDSFAFSCASRDFYLLWCECHLS